jgi:hypothetical protein
MLPSCAILGAKKEDNDAVLALKCAGSLPIALGTLGLASLFVQKARREGRFVGACDTLMGVESPHWTGEQNAASAAYLHAGAASALAPPPIQAQTCCRICTIGKACGNSCIAAYLTCHQPPGCACDG